MKWRQTSRYSWATPDGYTVAKFRVADKELLGVTPPDGRKPAFFGDRAGVLGWIAEHKEGIMVATVQDKT